MQKIMIIGGTGSISASTVDFLLSRNCSLALLNRSGNQPLDDNNSIVCFKGDRNNPVILREAMDQFCPDITVDFCCFTPLQAEQVIWAIKGRVKKHVFISTCDIYGYPLSQIPFSESDSFHSQRSSYARNKLICEQMLHKEFLQGNIPLTIVRPSYSLGPSFVINFFSRSGGAELLHRLRTGKPVVVPGDGKTFMHPSSAFNTGRMTGEIIMSSRSVGENFTCGHDTYMTADDYYLLFAQALNVPIEMIHIPHDFLIPLEKSVIPDNLLSELTQFNVAFSMDKFKHFFPDFTWGKTLIQSIHEYIIHHDQQDTGFLAIADYEDHLIKLWNESNLLS